MVDCLRCSHYLYNDLLNNINMNIDRIITDKKGTIVDVRSSGEFMSGSVVGAINIPLQEIPQRINELKNLHQPIVFCCASGNRSEQATQFLKENGIDCYNGGSWLNVNYFQSKTV